MNVVYLRRRLQRRALPLMVAVLGAIVAWDAQAQPLAPNTGLPALQLGWLVNCEACVSLGDLTVELANGGTRAAQHSDFGPAPYQAGNEVQPEGGAVYVVASRRDDQNRSYATQQQRGFSLRGGGLWSDRIVWRGFCDGPVLSVRSRYFMLRDRPIHRFANGEIVHALTLQYAPLNTLFGRYATQLPEPAAKEDRDLLTWFGLLTRQEVNVCLGTVRDVSTLLRAAFEPEVQRAATSVESAIATGTVQRLVRQELLKLLQAPEVGAAVRALATSAAASSPAQPTGAR